MSELPPPPPRLIRRNYRVISVPTGCENYVVDQVVEIFVPESEPTQVVIDAGGDCNQVIAERTSLGDA